jgi:hypothetical protein
MNLIITNLPQGLRKDEFDLRFSQKRGMNRLGSVTSLADSVGNCAGR